MRIDGVDPNVVESVREKVVQPVVRNMRETKEITEDYKEHEERKKEGRSKGLDKALDQLNNVCQTMGNPVVFRLAEKDSQAVVEVYDGEEDKVVKEVTPEEVVSVVTQVERLLGLLIDARI